MKVLHVVPRFPPSVGGSQRYVYRISKELVSLEHEVSVATSTSLVHTDVRGFSTSRLFSIRSRCPEIPNYKNIRGIKVYRFKPIFKFWTWMVNPTLFYFLCKNIDKFDVIHAHCYMHAEPDFAAIATKLCSINQVKKPPFILTAYDLITPYSGIYPKMKGIYDKCFGKLTLRTADILIALTSENKNEYINLGEDPRKIRIIPGGIDLEEIELAKCWDIIRKLGNPEKIVLSVARLVKYKGMQYIVKAIPKICKEYPRTKFVFVGEDQGYKTELIRIAEELKVVNRCLFLGKCERELLLKLYATADVFVLPSVCEGFGLAALESIASGTPVILANRGGLKDILRDVGGYSLDMERNVPDQIAENVIRVFSDQNAKKEVDKQRTTIMKRYTWENVVKKHVEIYESVT